MNRIDKKRHDIFHLDINGLEIVARTALVYGALLVGLRVAGKREIGQMTTFDLVVILLVSNAVQNAMVGPDTSVSGGLIAAGVLLGGNFLIAQVSERLPWVRKIVEGTPTLLVMDGSFVPDNMSREGVEEEEVLMALREHGVADISQVAMAVLEVDGSISVVPKQSPDLGAPATIRRRNVRFLRKH